MIKKYLWMLSFAFSGTLVAQNVGVGIAVPTQKLHVADGVAPNVATIRVSGLSSTSALAAGTGPFKIVIVDANGVMYRGATAGAGNNDAWYILGNAGTVAGTNFIGTTDAVDFVTKTGGSAAANERLRVLSTGPIVGNRTTALAGDVFSIFGTNAAGAINALGASAINGYVGADGIGVYGQSNGVTQTTGIGILGELLGTSTAASNSTIGVYGNNTTAALGTGATASTVIGVEGDVTGDPGTAFTIGVAGYGLFATGDSRGAQGLTISSGGIGVAGFNNAATGANAAAHGIYGQTNSQSAYGVYGWNTATAANPSHGVQGVTNGVGSAAAIRGIANAAAIAAAQNTFGVRGSANQAPTGTGFVMGVRGDVAGATGSTYGVYGQSASATGFGLDAVNTNATGTGLIVTGQNAAGTFLVGGSGAALNGNGLGTLSIAKTAASGVGLVGVGNNLVASILVPASGAGVVGVGAQYGIMGYATTTVSTTGNNNSAFNGAAASAGGYFEVQAAGIAQTWAYVGVRDNGAVLRKIIGPGTVNTIVKDTRGNLVTMSCPEAPENLFQDYGKGQLVNGRVHITIDPILAKNIAVNAEHPLRVFIQLEGDCKGVFVTNKSENGFDVVELAGGTSNTAFMYTIVANRGDEVNNDGTIAKYSAERFVPAPGPQQKTVLQTKEENVETRNVINETVSSENLPKAITPQAKTTHKPTNDKK